MKLLKDFLMDFVHPVSPISVAILWDFSSKLQLFRDVLSLAGFLLASAAA
jgi:hypothetical protein